MACVFGAEKGTPRQDTSLVRFAGRKDEMRKEINMSRSIQSIVRSGPDTDGATDAEIP